MSPTVAAPGGVFPQRTRSSNSGRRRHRRAWPGLGAIAVLMAFSAFSGLRAAPVAAAGDPVVGAAGDISCDPAASHYNGGKGTGSGSSALCQQLATSNVLVNGGFTAVLPLGDNQYYCGSLTAFQQAYQPSWGRLKSISHPVPGNHEYITSGGSGTTGCDSSNAGATGYFSYFGSLAGKKGAGYYSFNLGAWHLIALNSQCSKAGGCGTSSPQYEWLAADLAAHKGQCILAYWHIPLFGSNSFKNSGTLPFWKLLYAAHADLILNGHAHDYERFKPQNPSGAYDPQGLVEFIAGTGGENHTSFGTIAANSVVRSATSYGILKLTLHSTSYSWKFLPVGSSFTDSGSAACHNP